MRVMVIMKATKDSEAGVQPSKELMTAMGNYNEELVKAGISDRHWRAQARELIAGYWIWQVRSMEEAVEWLKRCPNPHGEDSEVEIRPVFEAEDFGENLTPEAREQERLRERIAARK